MPNGDVVIEKTPMSALVLDDRNARRGNIASIIESLTEFGQHRPVVAQRGTGRIIVGNHMYRAAQALGWEEIMVWWVDDDDKQAIRRGIADNATGDQAKWNEEELAALLEEVGVVPGFDEEDQRKLLAKLEKDTAESINPSYPLVPRTNEAYSYVLVVAKNEIDAAYLKSRLGVERAQSYKSQVVAPTHVIDVEKLREMID